MTARLLKPHGIAVAHKPSGTLRQMLSQPKGKTVTQDKTNVIYEIPCGGCNKKYVGQTGRKLATRLHEHQLAVRRHDQLSLISVHEDGEGHTFNWMATKILAEAKSKHAREFLEAWFSTNESINKHVDLEPIYEPLRNRDRRTRLETTYS